MLTLTFGLKLPETGDKGSIFFPGLEANITQLDSHDHDGVTSKKIPTSSLDFTTQEILAASWVDLTMGNYRQLVTMPAGLLFDENIMFFRDSTSGNYYQGLTVEKNSANTYYVYINDNTITLTAFYV